MADRLRSAKLRDDAGRPRRHDRRVADLEAALADHPLAGDPGLRARLRATAAVDRLERDVQRLERRIRGRNDSLARQFDRVLRVLESWGYVDGWSLTPAGERLARLYTETDLLLAEAIGEGLLDGLRTPEIAAVVSCFTYERRGPDSGIAMPPARWPSKTVALRSRAIEQLARDLNANEDDAGLPETRLPDPGFTAYAHEWAAGESLADVLDDDEMTGGDFVRHVKQCIDLLRQIGDVAPERGHPAPGTRRSRRLSPGRGGGVGCRGGPRRRLRWACERARRGDGPPGAPPTSSWPATTGRSHGRWPITKPVSASGWDPDPAADFARVVGIGGPATATRRLGRPAVRRAAS